MQYKSKAVQALADMWEEYEPALQKGIEAMGVLQRGVFKTMFQFFDVPSLLEKFDNDPGAVEIIKKGMMRVMEAMKDEEAVPAEEFAFLAAPAEEEAEVAQGEEDGDQGEPQPTEVDQGDQGNPAPVPKKKNAERRSNKCEP